MPSFGHVAVGMALGRAFCPRGATTKQLVKAMVGFAVAAEAPDLDAIAFVFRIPYANQFGHRGASHSLFVALVVAICIGFAAWVGKRRGFDSAQPERTRLQSSARFGAFTFIAVASHGLLDSLTDGGLGCALLWPFSADRFFAQWQPIPVAPIGLGMLSARGLRVVATEVVMFLPLVLFALWRRRSQGEALKQ